MDEIKAHYADLVQEYRGQYDRARLENPDEYTANYFRLQHILQLLPEFGVKRILDAGCGEGSPMVQLLKSGYDVKGFDFVPEMVQGAKRLLAENSFEEDRACWGDITDLITFSHLSAGEPFDAIISLGVLPHVDNEILVLKNLHAQLKSGGIAIIEFRNELFDMFALNRPSFEFYMRELFDSVQQLPKELAESITNDIHKRFQMEFPVLRKTNPGSDAPSYDMILAKRHNPFTVDEYFNAAGFEFVRNAFYHYHPYPPYYRDLDKKQFQVLSHKLEHENSRWKGPFMASAFVAVAIKK